MVYAVSVWTQQITWTVSAASFTVDGSTQGSPVNLGVVDSGHTENRVYNVFNNGNTPVTVQASDSTTGADTTWDTTEQTIPIGESRQYTLTIENFTADGACDVTFTVT